MSNLRKRPYRTARLRSVALATTFLLVAFAACLSPKRAMALPACSGWVYSSPVTVSCSGLGSTCDAAWNAYEHDCYGQAVTACSTAPWTEVADWQPYSSCYCSGDNCFVGFTASYTCGYCIPFGQEQ
jgi:hypothetical protein